MGSLRLNRTRSLRRKKQRRSSKSISFRSNFASLAIWGSLANLEVLSPLSWDLLLWRQPSHFWRLSLRLARTILQTLARMDKNSPKKRDNQATEEQVPAQEKEAEVKEKKDVEPEKEKEMETQDDTKEDSDFEVIPEVSEKTSIYPTLPSEEQTRLWKTNQLQPENKDGRETAEKMDTSAEDIKDNNEKEDKVEAALKTMQAMGFSDDGGWLSSLLRAKSGDVGKVLDAIKPVKN